MSAIKWHQIGNFTVFVVVTSLVAMPALASVPISVSQQGKLLHDDGTPMTGTQTLEFALYDAAEGGTILWSDAVTEHLDDNGVYSVELGDSEQPIDAEVLSEDEVYLGLTVDTEEMSPRMQLTSVPFASLADTAEVARSVEEESITADALAPGAVTADVVDAIDWNQIDGIPPAVTSDTLDELNCADNELAMYDGGDWGCVSFPSYSGDDFALADQSCPGDDVVSGISTDGALHCTGGGGGTYTAGTGLELSDDEFSVDTGFFDDNYHVDGDDISMGWNDIEFSGASGRLYFRDASLRAPTSDQVRLEDGDFSIEEGGRMGIGFGSAFDEPVSEFHLVQDETEAITVERDDAGWSMGKANTGNLWFQHSDDIDGTFSLAGWVSDDDGTWNTPSDARLKEDVEYLDGILDDITSLRAATYRYRDNEEGSRRSYGFMAQEVMEIFPDAVRYEEEFGHYGLSYNDFAVLSVQAIGEQQEIIDEQQRHIEHLEGQIDSFDERLRRLEE